jgi:hypothetical protein
MRLSYTLKTERQKTLHIKNIRQRRRKKNNLTGRRLLIQPALEYIISFKKAQMVEEDFCDIYSEVKIVAK